jgi:hypothetical protein
MCSLFNSKIKNLGILNSSDAIYERVVKGMAAEACTCQMYRNAYLIWSLF